MLARAVLVASAFLAIAAQSLPSGAVLLCVHPDGAVAIELFGEDCCGETRPGRDGAVGATESECGGCTDTDLGAAAGPVLDRGTTRSPLADLDSQAPSSAPPLADPHARASDAHARSALAHATVTPASARLAGATPIRI
jgi:hypothetical protein